MLKKSIHLILTLCLLALTVQAQTITDKNIYPEPPPPILPAAGGAFTDPVFHTTLLRVTDERDGKSNTNSYSYWPSLNCNNTRLFYTSDGTGMIADFDAVNLRISNKRPLWAQPLPGGGQLGTEDAIWSGLDPDVIYSHWAMKIWAYNVKVNTYTLVADFTGKAGIAANLQQMSKSPDDNAFGFNIQDTNWNRLGCLAWRKSQNDIYTYFGTIDEVEVDKTGKYLVVLTGQQGAGVIETKIVNLDTRTVTDLTDNAPDFAPGHKDVGKGTVIGEDNWNNGVTFRQLAMPHQFINVLSSGSDWSQGRHISTLADDEAWMLVSAYVVPANPPASGPFHNEIFLVSTDGQQRVRRICHHHSVLRDYWDSPRADISRDGRFAVFTSNWGSTTRRDVFVVAIPPVGGTTLPPAPGITIPRDGAELVIRDSGGRELFKIRLNPQQ